MNNVIFIRKKDIDEFDTQELPIIFINQDDRCFSRFDIISLELYYMDNNSNTIMFDAEGNSIRQHNRGISIDIKNKMECSLRIADGKFTLSIIRCDLFDTPVAIL